MSNTGFMPGGSTSNGGLSRFQSKPSAPQRQFVPVEYTAEEHQRIQLLLDKVLGPEYVSSRPGGGGQKVSYIEGWRALNLANEIFGFNGWNSELISTQVDFFDTHGNSGRFSMGLSVVVRVTIKDGAYHEDFGYGYIDNAKSKAMAFEKCKKEAFTDGVKRCLRCFGNVLGNCLYDRSIIAKMQKVKLPQPELQDSDFYRDPMLVEREKRKRMETKVNILETPTNINQQNNQHINTNQNSNPQNNQNNYNQRPQNTNHPQKSHNQPQNNTTNGNHSNGASSEKPPKTYTPSAQELEELDASFFSDDMLDDDAHEEAKATSDVGMSDITNITENAEAGPDPKTSKFPLFVSAKGADLVQQSPEDVSKIPQFDPKFVSPNIRRTLDPSKSAPVKRSEPLSSQTRYPPSQTEGNSLGKRIGMPPSQRPANKRYRPDS